MKPKVLTVASHPGSANTISPVIRRLKEDSKLKVVAIGHKFAEKNFTDQNIPYKTINDYNLSDVSVSSMGKILEKESPDLVLTGTSTQDKNNSDVIEQTITLAAQRMNINSLAVLDFWGNYEDRFNDTYTGKHFKFLPTKIAIMDNYTKKDMLEECFPEDILVITGNPHFDNLESKARNFTETEKQNIRKQISPESDLILFYASNAWRINNLGYWDLDNIQLINEVLNDLPEKQRKKTGLVTKLHPRIPEEDSKEINRYIKQNQNIRLITNIHPQELVLASNLTLTPFSTVGIEAVYMKKPCISIQPGLIREDYLSILTKNGIIPFGHTTEDCKSLIQKAILDTQYREIELINKASSFRTDGKATERVTDLVYSMLK